MKLREFKKMIDTVYTLVEDADDWEVMTFNPENELHDEIDDVEIWNDTREIQIVLVT